jgi:hypothetical protein
LSDALAFLDPGERPAEKRLLRTMMIVRGEPRFAECALSSSLAPLRPFPGRVERSEAQWKAIRTQRSKAANHRIFLPSEEYAPLRGNFVALDPGSGSASLHPPGKGQLEHCRE